MKTIYILTFLIISAAFSFTSCKSDDDNGGGGSAANGTVTAKVNGSTFTSMEMASQATRVSQNGVSVLTILGSDASGKAINLIINNLSGTGTYNIGGENLVFVTASYVETNMNNPMNSQTWMSPYEGAGITGEINISELSDSNVKGTFHFSAKNSNDGSMKEITEGSFNLSVTNF